MTGSLRIDPQRVRILAALRGINTNEELAQRAGITQRTLTNIMSGKNARLDTVAALAKALESHPFDILVAEGFPSPHVEAPAIHS